MILGSVALLPSPALAQTAAPTPQTKLQLPPDTAERITDALQSVSKAVHDLAGRDDPLARRDMDRQIAEAWPKIDQGVKAVNQALPEITADLQRAQKAVQRAIANMPDPNYPRR